MKINKLFKILLTLFLLIVTVACGDSDSKDYPSNYPKSDAQTKENVLYPLFPQTNTISDGVVATIDYSNASEGYIGAKLLNNNDKKVKIQIGKDDIKYNYDLTKLDYDSFPLQLGNGVYTFKILENIEGDNYSILASNDINVSMSDEDRVYLYPNQIADYNANSKIVDESFKIVKGDEDDLTRVYHLYNYVLDNLKYDEDKAIDVSDKYVLPDIDSLLETHKGICFDYASMLAALCRIQNIKARIITGYTDVEGNNYHSWVEIYLEGKGWINPRVEFKKDEWTLVDPTFADSGQDYEGRYDEVYHY